MALLILFQFARFAFVLFNRRFASKAGMAEIGKSFIHGLKMDISMTTYLLIPLFLLIIIFQIAGKIYQNLVRFYSSLILFILLFLFIADIGLYQAWGFRLDSTPLKYINNPKEMWATISYLPVFWIIILFLILYLILLKLFNNIIKHIFLIEIRVKKPIHIFISVLFFASLIIPMRGGFQLAPLNQSSVYFSIDNFSNQAAINPVWNFIYSLNHNIESTTNPFIIGDERDGKKVMDDLYTANGETQHFIDTVKNKNPNVILIVWESFTKKIVDQKKGGIEITPCYNQLKKQGIYFPDFYATGDRTDKGIVAVLSGYPAQPTTSIVKIPAKASHLPMLSKVFADQHYHTSFYYGGEPEFANMKAYLLQGKFQKFITVDDFPSSSKNSKWGAHDDVVAKRLFNDLQQMPHPFFTTWLTLSSHEPFETPVKTAIPGTDNESQFLNSMHYTDASVNEFVQQCSKQPWWKNTILIIVPDHGSRMPAAQNKRDDFKISLLMLGGALQQTGITINKIGSQTDLPSILLNQIGLPADKFIWSKNVLDSSVKPWAYFAFNNGFGFIEPESEFVFDNIGKNVIEKNKDISADKIKEGQFIQQLTFADYLSR